MGEAVTKRNTSTTVRYRVLLELFHLVKPRATSSLELADSLAHFTQLFRIFNGIVHFALVVVTR